MTLNEYQKEATALAFWEKDDIVYNALGIAGEAGELVEHVKKMLRDDDGKLTNGRREDLEKELGDVLWYVAKLAKKLDLTLEEVAKTNIKKIIDRKERGTQHGSGDNR
jgi:NTP pyrophosphatase (non-canonical NTP hydrolase)